MSERSYKKPMNAAPLPPNMVAPGSKHPCRKVRRVRPQKSASPPTSRGQATYTNGQRTIMYKGTGTVHYKLQPSYIMVKAAHGISLVFCVAGNSRGARLSWQIAPCDTRDQQTWYSDLATLSYCVIRSTSFTHLMSYKILKTVPYLHVWYCITASGS